MIEAIKVDASNALMANQPRGPHENTKSKYPAPVEKEEKTPPVQPQRQPRLSSRVRRQSPPPQHLLADYEEHWAKKIQSENQRKGTEEHLEYTSWIYDDDRERYQYINQ